MSVVAVGLEHRHTSLDVLERVTVGDAEAPKVLAALHDCVNVQEVVLLSTCLRTDVYAVVDRFHDAVAAIEEVLAARAGAHPDALGDHIVVRFDGDLAASAARFGANATALGCRSRVRFDDDVASYLFRVASGLESAVPGESEVLGQVRRAWEQAQQERASGPVLGDLFRHAVFTGKRVRSETAIARGTTSFSHAAVELAGSQRSGGLKGARVVVAGAGVMGRSLVRALGALAPGDAPEYIVVSSRQRSKAAELAAEVRGAEALGTRVDDLADELAEADVLFTALHADAPVLGVQEIAPLPGGGSPQVRERPLVIVDMGVPRNVATPVRHLQGVTLFDIQHLSAAVDRAMESRRQELDEAMAIVAREVRRYRSADRARGAGPVVASLRSRIEELRRSELERRRRQLPDLSDGEWRQVDAVTRAVLAKLVHEPTVALKETAGTPRGERLVEALRILFDL